MRDLARNLGMGKVILYGYHRPLGILRQSIAEGGPWEQRKTEACRLEMIEAAKLLPQFPTLPDTFSAKVNFLSGRKYWYQTLFCFASLQALVPFRITPVVFDDGTISSIEKDHLAKVVPWTEFIGVDEINERLNQDLPRSKFPTLRSRRLEYPHLRKLTDLHAGQEDWRIVLDSDMLFFNRPDELIDWFERPYAFFMEDIADAYGYSAPLMSQLSQMPVLSRVNVGLYGLDRAAIDWEKIEYWCKQQLEIEGSSYLQEQGLTALELTAQGAQNLNVSRYLLMPTLAEGRSPTAVMHHYVAHSKRSYFQNGWRHVVPKLFPEASSN